MGTEESCGRGRPQRTHEAGKRAQLTASMGLRSTRATARQLEVSEGGTSNVSEPESLRKTHLTCSGRSRFCAALPTVYSSRAAVSTPTPRPDHIAKSNRLAIPCAGSPSAANPPVISRLWPDPTHPPASSHRESAQCDKRYVLPHAPPYRLHRSQRPTSNPIWFRIHFVV
jgi:hypothetical protein